jgi:hypothetical protein
VLIPSFYVELCRSLIELFKWMRDLISELKGRIYPSAINMSSSQSEQLAIDKQKVPIEVFINLHSSTDVVRVI